MSDEPWVPSPRTDLLNRMQDRITQRKALLYICAYARHVGQWVTEPEFNQMIDAAEMFADDIDTRLVLAAAIKKLHPLASRRRSFAQRPNFAGPLYDAVRFASREKDPKMFIGYMDYYIRYSSMCVAEAVVPQIEIPSAFEETHALTRMTMFRSLEDGCEEWEVIGSETIDITPPRTHQKTEEELKAERNEAVRAAHAHEQIVALALVRELFGDPELIPDDSLRAQIPLPLIELAGRISASRDFGSLPDFAEQLQATKTCPMQIIEHLRSEEMHVKGCWAMDWLLNPTLFPRSP